MTLQRIIRSALMSFSALLLLPLAASAATAEYYVDYSRTTSGNGSATSPWKSRSNINWSTVKTALQSGQVTIYFSSRATWNDNEELTIPANTNAGPNRLKLDGQSKYNTVASGTAVWQTETISTNQARMTNAGGTGGTIYVVENANAFITIRGFYLLRPTWGGIILGTSNPTTNIHDILVENNTVDTPPNNHGVWLGYGETGCYNITVRRNTIIKTPLEAIYMGHYNYLANTITGTLVEYNTVIDAGQIGEGDIDIKPGNFGAIVRYNTSRTTSTGGVLGGIVLGSSDAQVYGNEMYNLQPRDLADGGHCIEITADGDGLGTGKAIANILFYNNLCHGNPQEAVAIFATVTGATVSNLKIMNNTFVSQSKAAIKASAAGAGTITISKLANNIFSQNSTYEVQVSSGVTISAADYNLYYHPASSVFLNYRGVGKTFAQWQALGFDTHGLNTDPSLNGSYVPQAGSSAIDVGVALTEFSIDKNSGVRTAPWDLGVYEIGAVPLAPIPPQGLQIVP